MNPGHYIGILSYLYAPVDKKSSSIFLYEEEI